MKTTFPRRPAIFIAILIGAIAVLVFMSPRERNGNAASKAAGESGPGHESIEGDAGPNKGPSDKLPAGESRHGIATTGAVPLVKLSIALQVQSGIKDEPLEATSYQVEATAYGMVLDLQPLTELRTRFNAALAETEIARSALNASKQEYLRAQALYQDNQNTSLKALQKSEQVYLSDEARLEAASASIQDIRGSARQQFGEPLASWALALASPDFQKLLLREEVLVRITFSPGVKIAAPSTVRLVANNNPSVIAYLVSASPKSDPAILGSTYFYRAATALAAGSHVTAHFATSSQPKNGVFIPGAAIVWYAGQSWSYVKLDSERFVRRPVSDQYPHEGGFFVSEGFKPGERVVVKGVQQILSEELRSQMQTGDSGENV